MLLSVSRIRQLKSELSDARVRVHHSVRIIQFLALKSDSSLERTESARLSCVKRARNIELAIPGARWENVRAGRKSHLNFSGAPISILYAYQEQPFFKRSLIVFPRSSVCISKTIG